MFLSGAFALFLSARREFLPHDVDYLGMTAAELCRHANCRIVAFMFHDRVAFGGTLIAIATLYLWLAAFPLRSGARWAWNAFAASGVVGFMSFLAYLGYGYLDSWHGVATLALLPFFIVGLIRSKSVATAYTRGWLSTPEGKAQPGPARIGRWCLIITGAGTMLAGISILVIGVTRVFVPEDLGFMGLSREALQVISPRLIPLIAHDRAGFGGGLLSSGLLVAMCAWYAPPSRAFWEALGIAGLAGFGCAIGIHYIEGYTTLSHLGPAIAGATLFVIGFLLEVIFTCTTLRFRAPAARRVLGNS